MIEYSNSEMEVAVNGWNQLFDLLAAEPRRQIIISLLPVPVERRLPLPEAAIAPSVTVDTEQYTAALQHSHLPKLASAGYVRWERDPFCVQRGPRFEVPAAVVNTLFSGTEHLPEELMSECIERNANP